MPDFRRNLALAALSCSWLLFVLPAVCAPPPTVTLGDRSVKIKTPRLEATLADGMIVGLQDLRTGEVHADPALADYGLPRGLGHLGDGGAAEMVKLHCPWGCATMDQGLSEGLSFPTMHRPGPGSKYRAEKLPAGVKLTWTGLTNGQRDFPAETLSLTAIVDPPTGQLLLSASGSSPDGGVYGLQAPLVNLHPDHAFYVASFGGVRYDKTLAPGLTTLGGRPFWEAPLVAVEGRQSSLGLWVEDAGFRPTFYFMNWSGKSFSAALESLNLMPCEQLRAAASVTWHLDSFAGGWVDAMTPYKQWYARAFAPELAQRAAVTWADKIQVIVDHSSYTDEVLRQVAATFDPETVLFHEWNARAPDFDSLLPDWTPRAGYADRVRLLHQYGFRTMAYVNTYCVNYNSPVFQRDHLQDVGLPRKWGGLWSYTDPPQSFAGVRDGQLMYLDPLSPDWRRYHTDQMVWWRQETDTDANYEDTGGCTGDFGNGVVAGKSGAQGGTEQFRELLRRNPSVPMACEYAPDDIAFAVRWPLRYQQVWGVDATRVWWMEHQRPVSAYIHGPGARPWIPVIRAEGDFARHVVAACSDALGGLGQFMATAEELRATAGMPYHWKLRAQLFAHRQLQPHFPPGRWPSGTACYYRDRDNRLYRYTATSTLQQMSGPDGQPLYQRLTGLNQFETPLSLPGWPASGGGKLLGLNPAVRYALERGAPDRTRVQVTGLPEGLRVARYDATAQRTLLVLEPVDAQAPPTGTVVLRANTKFARTLLNDQPADLPPWDEQARAPGGTATYATSFPAAFVFVEGAPQTPALGEYFGDGRERGRFLSVATGLERGGEYDPPHRAAFPIPGETPAPPFFLLIGGSDCEVVMDWLVRVPAANTALRVYVKNTQSRYGNGAVARLYVNGRLAHELDLGPQPNPAWKTGDDPAQRTLWANSDHGWTLPLGRYAGQPVAITLATDAKNENNADTIWWSRPKLVADPAQQAAFVRYTDQGTAVPE